jgi:hypothetical protein
MALRALVLMTDRNVATPRRALLGLMESSVVRAVLGDAGASKRRRMRFDAARRIGFAGGMRYKVVEAKSASELERLVQGLLDAGWKLQGGVALGTYGAGQWWYYQAMVQE